MILISFFNNVKLNLIVYFFCFKQKWILKFHYVLKINRMHMVKFFNLKKLWKKLALQTTTFSWENFFWLKNGFFSDGCRLIVWTDIDRLVLNFWVFGFFDGFEITLGSLFEILVVFWRFWLVWDIKLWNLFNKSTVGIKSNPDNCIKTPKIEVPWRVNQSGKPALRHAKKLSQYLDNRVILPY